MACSVALCCFAAPQASARSEDLRFSHKKAAGLATGGLHGGWRKPYFATPTLVTLGLAVKR